MEVVSIGEPVAGTTDRELGNKTDDIIHPHHQNKQYRFFITRSCAMWLCHESSEATLYI